MSRHASGNRAGITSTRPIARCVRGLSAPSRASTESALPTGTHAIPRLRLMTTAPTESRTAGSRELDARVDGLESLVERLARALTAEPNLSINYWQLVKDSAAISGRSTEERKND